MKPTIGRIVLYTNLGDKQDRYPPEAHPAIITKVTEAEKADSRAPDETHYDVSLRIFYEDGEFSMKNVPFTTNEPGTRGACGHWAWPPRV